MEITDAYRKARRTTSIFCGISLAWSAAQLDVKSLDIGTAGKIDLSGASIPAIFTCVIIYIMVRCTLEFMMQPNEIRRWNLAQIDYKITLNLVRLSLLVIAAATAVRSIETVIGVTVAALALIIGYFVLVLILITVLMPLRMFIRSRQGRVSAASSAIEATYWSMFIVAICYLLFFIALVFASIKQLPLIKLLPNIPNQVSTTYFAITAILIAVSFFYEGIMQKKIFAFEPEKIVVESRLPDGTIGVAFKDIPNHPDHVSSTTSSETQKNGD
jgi:hypothetical protein